MQLPPELDARLAGYTVTPVHDGESDASVWRYSMRDLPTYYLKTASLTAGQGLDEEANRLRWMQETQLPVPAVCDYVRLSDAEFLLLEEVSGVVASDSSWAGYF